MNTNTGNIETFSDGIIPEPKEDWIAIGDLVDIRGKQWRVTGMKPNGRLFLKLVKAGAGR